MFRVAVMALSLGASPAAQGTDQPGIVWSWSFTPPSAVNNNVATVLGGPDVDGDGWPDAVVAAEDYTVRLLSGHATGTPPVVWTFGGTDERPDSDRSLAWFPDVSGDGLPEILYTTGGNDRSIHLIRSADGAALWSYDVRETGCTRLTTAYMALPAGDLDGDGVDDAVAAIGGPCRLVLALSGGATGAGELLWQHPAGDGFRAVGVTGDLDGDRIPEILAGSGTNSADNRAMMLSGAQAAEASREIWSYEAGNMVADITAVDDITGDGIEDVVAGSWDSRVFALDATNEGAVARTLWEHTLTGGSFPYVRRTVRIPDLNGDCVDDIVVGSLADNIRVLSGLTGVPLWGPVSLETDQVPHVAVIPDVTGDQQWEVIAGTWNPGKAALFSGKTGDAVWVWDAPHNVTSVDFIEDIDGDGLQDVLAGGQDVATAWALSGRTVESCVRPVVEVTDVRVAKLSADRIRLDWAPVDDSCHRRYEVFGVPRDVNGCLARLVRLGDQDLDGDDTDPSWTGDTDFFGYLVLSVASNGGHGPLGHFRR